MSRIIIEEYLVEEIPICTLAKEKSAHAPIVFYLHGYTSDKKQGLAFGYELADLGFYFVALDAHMHGDRFDERLRDILDGNGDYVYPYESGLDAGYLMLEIILQSSRDLEVLMAHFGHRSEVDMGRIGLTGYSMGGFATFFIAANNPLIQVAVPIAGNPAFAARWSDEVLESSANKNWARAMDKVQAETARRTAFIEEIDPFKKMASFHPKPLMMISGEKDTDSPRKSSLDLYRDLKPLYTDHPERLHLNIHPDVGHQLTPAMIQDACNWFSGYMSGQEAA